jgi:hypothetical protein
MRAKEFIMKDAYSFDATDEARMASYKKMYDAYTRIFARCGLKAFPVEADTGVIGGKFARIHGAGRDRRKRSRLLRRLRLRGEHREGDQRHSPTAAREVGAAG